MSSSTVGVGADDLVTGEAVALELPAAGVPVRAVSGAVDVLATLVLLWAANIVAVLATADSDDALLRTVGYVGTSVGELAAELGARDERPFDHVAAELGLEPAVATGPSAIPPLNLAV